MRWFCRGGWEREASALAAHAWVECAGQVVSETAEIADFAPLIVKSTGSITGSNENDGLFQNQRGSSAP